MFASGKKRNLNLVESANGINYELFRQENVDKKTIEIEQKFKRLEQNRRYRKKNLLKIREREKLRKRALSKNPVGSGRWRKPEPVINDAGQEFESTTKAAEFYHVSSAAIIYACGNPNRTSCGLRWGYKKRGMRKEWLQPPNVKYNPRKRKLALFENRQQQTP